MVRSMAHYHVVENTPGYLPDYAIFAESVFDRDFKTMRRWV